MMNRNFCRAAWATTAVLGAAAGSLSAVAQEAETSGIRVTRDHAIDAYISENAIQALYMRDIETDDFGRIEARGGIFFNENRDLIGIVDALVPIADPAPNQRLDVRVGPRMYGAFLNQENEDIFGIGVGGQAEYYLNRERTISATLSLFYVPDILTFGAADNVKDVGLRLKSELQDGTEIYIGYRALELDVRTEDREVDDNVHLGFRRSF